MQIRSKSNTCTLFLPQEVENGFIFALRVMVVKIRQFFTLIRLIGYVN